MKTTEQTLRNRATQARYRARHLELNRKRQREYVRNLPPEKKQLRNLRNNRRKFGLTPEAYDAKLHSQDNLCKLCGEPFEETFGRTPVLDHSHETGVNRDFLHSNCNVAVGMLRDDPEFCRKAAAYLERHRNS